MDIRKEVITFANIKIYYQNMSYEFNGKLHKVFPTESKTATFQAREFVVESQSGSYAQFIKFQLTQDHCAILDDYNEGEEVKVHFDLRGREWNGKYFTNLHAWRMEKVVSQAAAASPPPPATPNDGFPSEEPPVAGGTDDLPF